MEVPTLLLSIIPENLILEMLEEAIKEHKILNTSETKKQLKSMVIMYSMKLTVAENMESVLEFEKEIEQIRAGMNLLNPKIG